MAADTATASISVIGIVATPNSGKLHALADVLLVLDGVEIVIHGIQVRADNATSGVCLPKYRSINGEWLPAITLPDEILEPLGDAVLAAGIEIGVLRERNLGSTN